MLVFNLSLILFIAMARGMSKKGIYVDKKE